MNTIIVTSFHRHAPALVAPAPLPPPPRSQLAARAQVPVSARCKTDAKLEESGARRRRGCWETFKSASCGRQRGVSVRDGGVRFGQRG
eukprot:3935473-Rhodomonas_salina.1